MIVLTDTEIFARILKTGEETVNLEAGEWLKIKIAENYILQEKVPDGKRWSGSILCRIEETSI